MVNMHRYQHSLDTYKRGREFLVPGSTTISKSPILYPFGAYPIYLVKGKGCTAEDIDGNQYLDFQGALGANILGTAYPAVIDAIIQQAKDGTLFSLAHPLAIKVAEQICELVPSAERVRLLKNGSDATSGAIRIARAYTGREHIAICHFHGWHDWYYVSTSKNRGIPQSLNHFVHQFSYNDLASLEAIFKKLPGQIAAVIMEPVNIDPPKEDFLGQIKRLAEKEGSLLIFDEVVTGFRFSTGGAQKYFQVTPHLSCFAKALSNGCSLSAIAGLEEIMMSTNDVITSMTFAEETMPLAAASATLSVLKKEPVVEHIFRLGGMFKDEFNQLSHEFQIPITCEGLPPRMVLAYKDYAHHTRKSLKGYFLEQMALRGVLIAGTIFMNYSHTEEAIHSAIQACRNVFHDISNHREAKQFPTKGEEPQDLW